MRSKAVNLGNIKVNPLGLDNTSAKVSLGEVFYLRKESYVNEFVLFVAHFNTIPNLMEEEEIDCVKANKWFVENYRTAIKDIHYNKVYFKRNKNAEYDDIFYILCEDLIVNFDTNCSRVRFLFRKTEITKIEEIITNIKRFKERKVKHTPEISLLLNTDQGISTRSFKIVKPKLSIADNYNDDFKIIHQTIIKRLSTKNDKGLVLLHGKPGTGKTSYIRYLITLLEKDVIFLPLNMASSITDPNLISVLIDNPNCVFVIEDAEHIITDREKNGRSPVAALLNISDGLLSDCLNIQVICSFNTDISRVDSALMRKGRLIAKYEFKELEWEKAQLLSNKLNFSSKITKPMTLTEIYNQEEMSFEQTKPKNVIGFTANNN